LLAWKVGVKVAGPSAPCWEFIESRAVTCGFSHTSKDKERKRRGWRANPSVFLLSDEAAREHTGEGLAKGAKEICLIQCGRLLI